MRLFLLFHFVLAASNIFGQNYSGVDTLLYFDRYYTAHYLSVSLDYDISNRLISFGISNGFDERPLIHFEDFTEKIAYKIYGQTNFEESYKLGGNISFLYANFGGYLGTISLVAEQLKLGKEQSLIRSFDLSTSYNIKLFTELYLTGHIVQQRLSKTDRLGMGLGLHKGHLNVYYGAQVDYLKSYFNYNAYLHSWLIPKKLSLHVSYDHIQKFDFLNVGINLLFSAYKVEYFPPE